MFIACWEANENRGSRVEQFFDLPEILENSRPKDWPDYVLMPVVTSNNVETSVWKKGFVSAHHNGTEIEYSIKFA